MKRKLEIEILCKKIVSSNDLLMKEEKSMDSLYIVMPAYNEEGNIENVVKAWYPILEGKAENSRLVIADYGSKDKTHEILQELKNTKYPKGPKLLHYMIMR